jgi:hypothetical protein
MHRFDAHPSGGKKCGGGKQFAPADGETIRIHGNIGIIRYHFLYEFGRGRRYIEPFFRSSAWKVTYWALIVFALAFWIFLFWFSYHFDQSYTD